MLKTIDAILDEGLATYGPDPYVFTPLPGEPLQYRSRTYAEFVEQVRDFAGYLQSLGLTGEKVGIVSANCYGYMVADVAIMAYVGTSVCISKDWKYYDVHRILEKIDLGALIYGEESSSLIAQLRETHPDLRFIPIENVLVRRGHEITEPLRDVNDCARIVFSSGTTGNPKAVMLSTRNILACWENLCLRTPFDHTDVDYLFLPMHHTYAGVCNTFYSIISGMRIYFCRDVKNMLQEIQTVKPTLLCTVPLILRRLVDASRESGTDMRELLGSNIRYLYVAGAVIDRDSKRYCLDAGLNVLDAYGMSETSSLIAVEYSHCYDLETVGTVFENMEVEILDPDDDGLGEVAVKGENVFLGYYGQPELTRKAMTADGFFKTGDLGRLQGDKLVLVGRKKRVIVLPNGENVYPEEVEKLFESYENVTKAKVFEDANRICLCLYTRDDASQKELFEPIVSAVNEKVPRYSRVQSFEVVSEDQRLK